MIMTGTRCASAGVTSVMQISTSIAGYALLSTRPTSCRPTTRSLADLPFARGDDGPRDAGHALRHAADDLALEVLDDLGSAPAPPRLGRRHLRAAAQRQRIGQQRIRVRFRFVVVRGVRRRSIGRRPRAQLPNAELLEHVAVIVGRGPGRRVGRTRRRATRAAPVACAMAGAVDRVAAPIEDTTTAIVQRTRARNMAARLAQATRALSLPHGPRSLGMRLASIVSRRLPAVRGHAMSFILWLIVGGLFGWVASMIMGTNDTQGKILNIVVGIVGAFLGGLLLAPLFGTGTINQGDFSFSSLIVSLLGAVILLFIVGLFRRKRHA